MDEIDEIGGLPGRKRRPGCFLVVLLSALTAAVVSIGLAYAQHFVQLPGLAELGAGAEPTLAPDITGISLEAAERLATAHGLEVDVVEERADGDVAAGDVISQQPPVAAAVPSEGTIEVVVSTGPPRVAVPDIAGQSLDEARAALTEAGLAVGVIEEGDAGDAEPGSVVASEPSTGDEVEPGTRVALAVAPSEPDGVAVPDVMGRRVPEARQLLEEAGLSVGRVRRRYDPRSGPHVVLEQDPAAEAVVEEGTAVALVANQGV